MKIVKRSEAKRDIIELADYIARDDVDAAERFLDAVETAIKFLARNPDTGALREYSNPSLAGLRMWPIRGFERHLVFYRKTPSSFEIVRVLHAARNIEAVFGEIHD